MVVAMKSKCQTSCSIKYGLEASLKIGRKTDKYEVAVVQPGMHKGHHKRSKAVIGDYHNTLQVWFACDLKQGLFYSAV